MNLKSWDKSRFTLPRIVKDFFDAIDDKNGKLFFNTLNRNGREIRVNVTSPELWDLYTRFHNGEDLASPNLKKFLNEFINLKKYYRNVRSNVAKVTKERELNLCDALRNTLWDPTFQIKNSRIRRQVEVFLDEFKIKEYDVYHETHKEVKKLKQKGANFLGKILGYKINPNIFSSCDFVVVKNSKILKDINSKNGDDFLYHLNQATIKRDLILVNLKEDDNAIIGGISISRLIYSSLNDYDGESDINNDELQKISFVKDIDVKNIEEVENFDLDKLTYYRKLIYILQKTTIDELKEIVKIIIGDSQHQPKIAYLTDTKCTIGKAKQIDFNKAYFNFKTISINISLKIDGKDFNLNIRDKSGSLKHASINLEPRS